ncbi:MAG: family 78 glycoside hydrolase catalytic domain, partial [Clostridia bacterium]|nr:family 78 glycoside hydrolase catalytic domain [Clostridia bacterium]
MFLPIKMQARHTPDGKIEFSWAAYHDGGGKRQTAYRLTAGGKDTGWVEGDGQNAVLSLGEKAGTEVKWTLTLRDDAGKVSEKGESSFTYWHIDSFRGQWIADPDAAQSEVTLFRKTFSVEKKPDAAFLFLSAAGIAEADLNGKRVGDRILAPNLTNFEKRRLYNAYAVEIREGENELTISLGDGWRRNLSGYLSEGQRKAVTFFGMTEVRAFVLLRYGDREETVGTDGTWLAGRGKTVFSHLFDGETFDARREASFGKRATVVTENRPEPIFDYLEPIREKTEFAPRSIVRMPDGAYILDFGQNMQGYLAVSVPGTFPAGTEIVIRHAEELDEDEGLYTAPLRTAKATDRIVTAGRAFTWKPSFTYHGFRYAEIRGWVGPLSKDDVRAKAILTDIQTNSSFESGSALLNAIQKNVVMTERSNLIGIATDCPQRDERMGWMNDATVRFEETPYNFDVSSLFPKIVDDLRDEQG